MKTIELGTLLASARAVSLSQSAVTQAIAKLEQQMNIQLFDRQNNGMRPTEAALMVQTRAKTALNYIGSTKVTHTQIKAFLSLSRGGSYSEASNITGLSAASLHRAIRDLEIVSGRPLTLRKGRGVMLTEFGQKQARQYGLAEAELRSMIEEIQALKGISAGRISVGAMPLCRAKILPSAIVAYHQQQPESDIRVAEGSFIELIEPLRNGDLDFLIGAMRDPGPGTDLIQKPLFEDAPVVLSRIGHPLGKAKKGTALSPQALGAYPWCVPESGVPLRDKWERLFTDAGLPIPRIAVECGSVIANRQILMKTDWLTLLSPDQVAVELEAGWLEIVSALPKPLNRVIGLTYREGWRPTKTQSNFLSCLNSVI